MLEVVEPDRKQRERQLDELLDEFNIGRLRKAPSIALSGGERRRCEIARALAGRPKFMLLDEPFAGIDPIAVGDIQNLVHHLKARGIGVLITDHNVRETLALTDRAYIIHSGRVLMEGRPRRSSSILMSAGSISARISGCETVKSVPSPRWGEGQDEGVAELCSSRAGAPSPCPLPRGERVLGAAYDPCKGLLPELVEE